MYASKVKFNSKYNKCRDNKSMDFKAVSIVLWFNFLLLSMQSWLYANPVLSMNQVMLQCLQCLLLHMLLQEQTVRPHQPVC